MARGLEQIRLVRRDTAEGVGWANFGDGALVAIDAAVVADLEEERAVAETVAAFDALRASDAQVFINLVFVVRVLHECALDGRGGAELVFRAGVEVVGLWLEIAGA